MPTPVKQAPVKQTLVLVRNQPAAQSPRLWK